MWQRLLDHHQFLSLRFCLQSYWIVDVRLCLEVHGVVALNSGTHVYFINQQNVNV